jgi:phosphoglycolate phosphatase
MARRIEPTLTDLEVAAIERGFRSDYDANGWRATVAFDGVSASLRRMRDAGLRLFIVTNKPRISTQGILEHLELDNVFESVLTRDARTPIYESKVAMLADLIRNQGLEAATSAMVGDTDEDREAAHRNGLPFVFVTYGYGSVPDAELVADNFETIESMLGLESEKQ